MRGTQDKGAVLGEVLADAHERVQPGGIQETHPGHVDHQPVRVPADDVSQAPGKYADSADIDLALDRDRRGPLLPLVVHD